MKIIRVACYALFLVLITSWLAIELQLFTAWAHAALSFTRFFLWTMASFAVITWLILSTPYCIFWIGSPQARKILPSYWEYMGLTRPASQNNTNKANE